MLLTRLAVSLLLSPLGTQALQAINTFILVLHCNLHSDLKRLLSTRPRFVFLRALPKDLTPGRGNLTALHRAFQAFVLLKKPYDVQLPDFLLKITTAPDCASVLYCPPSSYIGLNATIVDTSVMVGYPWPRGEQCRFLFNCLRTGPRQLPAWVPEAAGGASEGGLCEMALQRFYQAVPVNKRVQLPLVHAYYLRNGELHQRLARRRRQSDHDDWLKEMSFFVLTAFALVVHSLSYAYSHLFEVGRTA